MHILLVLIIGFCLCFAIANFLAGKVRATGKRADPKSYKRAKFYVFFFVLGTLLSMLRISVLWIATSSVPSSITGLESALPIYYPELILVMPFQHARIAETLFHLIYFSLIALFTFAFAAFVAATTKNWRKE